MPLKLHQIPGFLASLNLFLILLVFLLLCFVHRFLRESFLWVNPNADRGVLGCSVVPA